METKFTAPHGGQHGGYERKDADVRSLLKFGLSLFVILVVVLISMKWTFSYFAASQQLGPPASPFENARVLPPQPRLQPQPRLDLEAYCSTQMTELNTYGWVDPHNEVVRIPVDRAMDLIIQRGLPSRPAPGAPPDGTAAPGATPAPIVPDASGSQGQCSYLVKPPAPKEEK
ncbi:MAG: hypothetical protein WB780_11295 [Candidatus Acidiferrales bacterium]